MNRCNYCFDFNNDAGSQQDPCFVKATVDIPVAVIRHKPHLLWALLDLHGKDFVVSGLVILPFIIVILIQPYFITSILDYIIQEGGSAHLFGIHDLSPLFVATLSGLLMVLSMLSINHTFYMVNDVDVKIRSGLLSLLFHKSLRLSVSARSQQTSGGILTLTSVDIERVWFGVLFAHWIWVGPLCMLSSLISLGLVVGVIPALAAAVTGIFIICVFFPLGRLIARARRDLVVQTEQRMKLINEALQGIRIIKMYSWEGAIQQRIDSARKFEMERLSNYMQLRACNTVFSFAGPTLMAFVVMVAYTQVGGELTVQKTYSIFAFLNVLRIPMTWMPYAWTFANEAMTSLDRMTEFMLQEEVCEYGPNNGRDRQPDSNRSFSAVGLEGICLSSVSEEISTDVGCNAEYALSLKDCSYDWTMRSQSPESLSISSPTLQHINLSIKRGELVAVVGAVGSGKSSLLSALLGHLHLLKGSETLNFGHSSYDSGSHSTREHGERGLLMNERKNIGDVGVGYAAQDHWIQNLSVRDNILFGEPFEDTKYLAVLRVSQLVHDLCQFPAGDATEIGERGINLSGGQKARVSVARALYAANVMLNTTSTASVNISNPSGASVGPEVFMFDDSLASLDVHVAKAMFLEAFKCYLKEKTRIICLSSHYHLLSHFDRVIVMESGRVVYSGCYAGLTAYPQYIATCVGSETDENSDSESTLLEGNVKGGAVRTLKPTPSEPNPPSVGGTGSSLTVAEESVKGVVTWDTYVVFASAARGRLSGTATWCALLILFAVCHGSRVLFDMWIGVWSMDRMEMLNPDRHEGQDITMVGGHHSDKFYFQWYIFLFAIFAVLSIVRASIFIHVCLDCSRNLFQKMMNALFIAPINHYFDVIPLGRILNHFSEDLDAVDSILPDSFLQNLQSVLFLASAFVMCVVITPYFLFVLVPLVYMIHSIQDYFRKTSRELKRMDRVTRSPIVSFFHEMLQGLLVIRAFGDHKKQIMCQQLLEKLELNIKCNYHFWMTNRWLSLRIDVLSAVIYMAVAIFSVLQIKWGANLNPNYVGIALVYTLQLTGIMQHTIRAAIETENGMTSVERLLQFSNIPREKESHLDSDPITKPTPGDGTGWPTQGEIVLSDLRLRYRPGLELTLKGINLTIPGGSKGKCFDLC